jgi:YbbR domain-containing protein
MDIPLEVRNISAKKTLKKEVPSMVQVRFSGTGHELLKAFLLKDFYDDYKLVLDLDRISEEYEFILNEYYERFPHKVVIPSSWKINFLEIVYPLEIKISLDEYLVKSVPVIPKIIIHSEPGFIQVGDINISPNIIDIAGPRELVDSLQWITTEPETLLALKEPVWDGSLSLHTPHPIIEYKDRSISYKIDIQKISERIISDIPVQVTRVPDGLRVFVNPRTVSLTAVGGVFRIADIYPEDFVIYVDFEDQWVQKKQFYAPTIVIPNDVIEWQDLSPRNIELVVTRDSQ